MNFCLIELFIYSSAYDSKNPQYDFRKLDTFLDKLTFEYNLHPTIEFMISTLMYKRKDFDNILWQNLAFQIISRYIGNLFEIKHTI